MCALNFDKNEVSALKTSLSAKFLNEYNKTSFFDFINEYRVQEARRIIRHTPGFTLLQVGYEAGFNNKTSFVNAFKRFAGQTPSVYRKTVLQNL